MILYVISAVWCAIFLTYSNSILFTFNYFTAETDTEAEKDKDKDNPAAQKQTLTLVAFCHIMICLSGVCGLLALLFLPVFPASVIMGVLSVTLFGIFSIPANLLI